MSGNTHSGFASFPPEKRREISSKGGKNAVNRYKWTPQTAKEAQQKGLEARRQRALKRLEMID